MIGVAGRISPPTDEDLHWLIWHLALVGDDRGARKAAELLRVRAENRQRIAAAERQQGGAT